MAALCAQVMQRLQEISVRTDGQLIVAYDWAGSSSANADDAAVSQKLRERLLWDEISTLGKTWQGLMAANAFDSADRLIDEHIAPMVKQTRMCISLSHLIRFIGRRCVSANQRPCAIQQVGGHRTRVKSRAMFGTFYRQAN